MKLSVVIPAHNEEGVIEATVRGLHATLAAEGIEHEIVVVDDGSKDRTAEVLRELGGEISELAWFSRGAPNGFGLAVQAGLDAFTGDAVAVYMADASDRPEDLVRFWRTMERTGCDCVFGTRFARTSTVTGYPELKLRINRVANTMVRVLFGFRYNDVTNAFKLYRREVIDGVRPLLSHHFNLTVELPLKAIVRGFTYEVVPNDWIGRTAGESKFAVKEMGSRYAFIVLYCLIERMLSRGDYRRRSPAAIGTRNGGGVDDG